MRELNREEMSEVAGNSSTLPSQDRRRHREEPEEQGLASKPVTARAVGGGGE